MICIFECSVCKKQCESEKEEVLCCDKLMVNLSLGEDLEAGKKTERNF